MLKIDITKYIKENEGLRLNMYHDSVGVATIGYGHNLTNSPITLHAAEVILRNDISGAFTHLYESVDVGSLNDSRLTALIDIIFTVGEDGFRKFTDMISAINNCNFIGAATALKESKLYREDTQRTKRNIALLLTN